MARVAPVVEKSYTKKMEAQVLQNTFFRFSGLAEFQSTGLAGNAEPRELVAFRGFDPRLVPPPRGCGLKLNLKPRVAPTWGPIDIGFFASLRIIRKEGLTASLIHAAWNYIHKVR